MVWNETLGSGKYRYGDHDPNAPWISPLNGLPPIFINFGSYETILDDSTRFAATAKEAGVETTLVIADSLPEQTIHMARKRLSLRQKSLFLDGAIMSIRKLRRGE